MDHVLNINRLYPGQTAPWNAMNGNVRSSFRLPPLLIGVQKPTLYPLASSGKLTAVASFLTATICSRIACCADGSQRLPDPTHFTTLHLISKDVAFHCIHPSFLSSIFLKPGEVRVFCADSR